MGPVISSSGYFAGGGGGVLGGAGGSGGGGAGGAVDGSDGTAGTANTGSGGGGERGGGHNGGNGGSGIIVLYATAGAMTATGGTAVLASSGIDYWKFAASGTFTRTA